jgi:hypothetical protein
VTRITPWIFPSSKTRSYSAKSPRRSFSFLIEPWSKWGSPMLSRTPRYVSPALLNPISVETTSSPLPATLLLISFMFCMVCAAEVIRGRYLPRSLRNWAWLLMVKKMNRSNLCRATTGSSCVQKIAEKQHWPLETCSTRRLGCLLDQGISDLPSRGVIKRAGELITRWLAFERYKVINIFWLS